MARRLFHKKKPFPLWASLSLLAAGLGVGYLLLPEPAPPERPAELAATTSRPEPPAPVAQPQPPIAPAAPPAVAQPGTPATPAPSPAPQVMGFGAELLDRPGLARGGPPAAADGPARPPAPTERAERRSEKPAPPPPAPPPLAPPPAATAPAAAPAAPPPPAAVPPAAVSTAAVSTAAVSTAATAGGNAGAPGPIAAEPGLLAPGGVATGAAATAPEGATDVLPRPVARARPPLLPAQRAQAARTADGEAAGGGTNGAPAAPTAVLDGSQPSSTGVREAPASPASPPSEPPLTVAGLSAVAPPPVAAPAAPAAAAPAAVTESTPAETAAAAEPDAVRPRGARSARVQLTSAVRNREPVDSLDSVASGQSVYGFSEVRGLAGRSVEHRWQHEGRTVASLRLKIGGDRWRVHSRKPSAAGDKGQWELLVLDDEGTVIGRTPFVVE